MLLVKVNTGTVTHIAKSEVNQHGATVFYTPCGSGVGKTRARFRVLKKEATLENVTCKKCQKNFESFVNRTEGVIE